MRPPVSHGAACAQAAPCSLFLRVLRLFFPLALLALAGCHSHLPAAGGAGQPLARYEPPAALEPSGIRFVDVARPAGLDYTYTIAGTRPLNILQVTGGGCAFLDFNHDGNLDVLLVGNPTPQLYQGDGKGHFTNVGEATHFVPVLPAADALWQGCAVGDYDNDGWPDIYLSGYKCGQLWHNVGGKKWVEVGAQAGLPTNWYTYWGTSCGFADFDGDGRLDLLVANYVLFRAGSRDTPQTCEEKTGVHTSCSPSVYYGQNPFFFHNVGAGRFREEAESRGFPTKDQKTLAIAFADYDDSGTQSVYLANDTAYSAMMHNRGKGYFRNEGGVSGTAYARHGALMSAMGADWADYDNDGRLDMAVSNYAGQGKPLFHNDGRGLFTDVQNEVGIGVVNAPYLTFGIKWLDYDNDGWPDLMLASGDIADTIHAAYPERDYRYPTQVFHNQGRGTNGRITFTNVGASMGPHITRRIVGRGLATGDFDNDGRIDALVVDAEGAPLLLHNEGGRVGHWVGLNLTGTGKSNRDAIGARVILEAGGRRYVKEVQTAGSFLSASDKRLLFGIGAAGKAEKITIRWPDGSTQRLRNVAAGKYYTIQESRDTQ